MTPREIYKAHICDSGKSAAQKRGMLDGLLDAAAGRSNKPLCCYAQGTQERADWMQGFEEGQQLHQDVKTGVIA